MPFLTIIRKRQLKDESGAAAGIAFHADPAMVFLDDALGDGESQPCAGSLAGKERLEDQRQVFRLYAGTAVRERDDGVSVVTGRCNAYLAPIRHCFQGVSDDVDQRLLDLLGIEPEMRNLARIQLYAHP